MTSEELLRDFQKAFASHAQLEAELAKFEPFGTGEPSALERTVESMEHAMIGWRWRALRAEKKLEEAYSIIQAMDAKEK